MMKKKAMPLAYSIINTGKCQCKPLSGDWVLCQAVPFFQNILAAICLCPASCRPHKRVLICCAQCYTGLPWGSLAASHWRRHRPQLEADSSQAAKAGREAWREARKKSAWPPPCLPQWFFCSEGLQCLPAVVTYTREEEKWKTSFYMETAERFFPHLFLFPISLFVIILTSSRATISFCNIFWKLCAVYKIQMKHRPCMWCSGCKHLSEEKWD